MLTMLHIPRTGGSFIDKKFRVCQDRKKCLPFDERFDGVNPHLLINGASSKHHFLCHSYENTIDPNLFNLIDQVDFVVFRNPYGWLYSYYTHNTEQHENGWLNIKQTLNIKSFEEFVNLYTDMSFEWPHPYRNNGGYVSACYNDDGKFIPKNIIFIEKLEEVADEFFELSRGKNRKLTINKPSKKYLEHYSSDMIKRVSKHFEKFNDEYGYTVDSGPREKIVTLK